MTNNMPQEDWIAYAIVILVVIAIMFGKYLIGKQ